MVGDFGDGFCFYAELGGGLYFAAGHGIKVYLVVGWEFGEDFYGAEGVEECEVVEEEAVDGFHGGRR